MGRCVLRRPGRVAGERPVHGRGGPRWADGLRGAADGWGWTCYVCAGLGLPRQGHVGARRFRSHRRRGSSFVSVTEKTRRCSFSRSPSITWPDLSVIMRRPVPSLHPVCMLFPYLDVLFLCVFAGDVLILMTGCLSSSTQTQLTEACR
jgi:hypothetical protein